MLDVLAPLILKIGTTLGVGASTFALTFFIVALQDGVIDESERRLMGVVYRVLRIGMVLIGVGLVCVLWARVDVSLASYFMQWVLLGVITLNAIPMTYRIMPMRIGPVLAGGSWYSFIFVSEPFLSDLSLGALTALYIGFLGVFFFVFEALKRRFLPPKPAA